ncbi:hypothetical protein [Halorhabdus sp. BNX81]|nr:hypothetical protein [Halorhabdus sp. BNX81]WEL22349.1 hypothetical protein HBNXHr_2303 [Halorhabdus sp. BNX81]
MCETASEKGDEMVQETINQAVEDVKALDFATFAEVTEAFRR